MPSSGDYHSTYAPSSSSSTIIASPAPSYVSSPLPSKLKSFFGFGGRRISRADFYDPHALPSDNKKSGGKTWKKNNGLVNSFSMDSMGLLVLVPGFDF
ncbi:hypothetical protein BX616_005627 [Lobosporangium transversale]|nr:hypothetical protein BX616_005627 [Lobosporangium transversale]